MPQTRDKWRIKCNARVDRRLKGEHIFCRGNSAKLTAHIWG